MPHLALPDDDRKIHDRLYDLRPDYREAFWLMKDVLDRSIMPERVLEIVRYRIVEINGCAICMSTRELLTEAEYDDIPNYRTSSLFADDEKLAVEYAERYVLDHHGIDADLWERLHAQFTDEEILDLTFFTSRYLAFSRMTHVLGLDDSCPLPPAVAARQGAGVV